MAITRDDVVHAYSKLFNPQYFDQRIQDRPFGWVVGTHPDEYYQHDQDPQYITIGNGPVYISRETGQVFITSSIASVKLNDKPLQTEADLQKAMQEIGVSSTRSIVPEHGSDSVSTEGQ